MLYLPMLTRQPVLLRKGFIYVLVVFVGLAVLTGILDYLDKGDFPESWRLPSREAIDSSANWVNNNLSWFFDPISDLISFTLEKFEGFLLDLSWVIIIAVIFALGLGLRRPQLALFSVMGLEFMGLVGLWEESMQTLSLMGVSVLACLVVGIPLGITASQNDRFESFLRPLLDTMQVMPPFVYLIPAIFLFGIGAVPGVVATFIYAIPPVIRLTNLGIRQVPTRVIEPATSFGSTPVQAMLKVRIPLALPSIMMGINQTIMMAMAMVIIVALVGASGLGAEIWIALRRIEVGRGFEGGLAVVFMAIIMDRLSAALSKRKTVSAETSGRKAPNPRQPKSATSGFPQLLKSYLISFYAVALLLRQALLARLERLITHPVAMTRGEKSRYQVQSWIARHYYFLSSVTILVAILLVDTLAIHFGQFPSGWRFSIRESVDDSVKWLNVNAYFITNNVQAYLFLYALKPLREFLLWLPWPVFILGLSLISFSIGGRRLATLSLVSLLLIAMVGMWNLSMDTLSQVIIAVAISVIIAIPLGILASRSNTVESILRPILDFLQTMPNFVYLIPVIMLFHAGVISGIIATVLYAIAPAVRLTNLGIRQVSPEVIEASRAYGASTLQTLMKVQLPLALPSIMMGINQTTMMALAMVIIAGIIGATGLGLEVVEAIARVQIGRGLEAGLSIVVLAVILDRLSQSLAKRREVIVKSG